MLCNAKDNLPAPELHQKIIRKVSAPLINSSIVFQSHRKILPMRLLGISRRSDDRFIGQPEAIQRSHRGQSALAGL
jgi:hypothetical protein